MRNKWKYLLLLLALGTIWTGVYYYLRMSKETLDLTHHTIYTEKLTAPIRIVQLSDLHNSEFGIKNADLAAAVAQQEPDVILLTGDFVNSHEESTRVAQELIAQLAEIAAVYVSNGNHEVEYDTNFNADISSVYREAGAQVLEKEYWEIGINGQKIRLGGIFGYCLPERYVEGVPIRRREADFLLEFQDTELFTILMTHMPACWIVNDGINEWEIDCVFAGHAHGGQIRLPFIGGVYAPDQGWFPGEVSGLYFSEGKDKVMVLSRGLGSTGKIPRFNNIPEIVVVDLMPDHTNP